MSCINDGIKDVSDFFSGIFTGDESKEIMEGVERLVPDDSVLESIPDIDEALIEEIEEDVPEENSIEELTPIEEEIETEEETVVETPVVKNSGDALSTGGKTKDPPCDKELLKGYFATKKTIKVPVSGGEKTASVKYTVKKGDNLSKIAGKYSGVSYTDIATANNISAPKYSISVGQKLRIPKQVATKDKVIYEKITKASIGNKVYLVVETKGYEKGESVKISVYEKEKMLVDANTELPFLKGTTQATEVQAQVKIDPDDGSQKALVEIALRPKIDKKEDDKSNAGSLEAWKENFKKVNEDDDEKKDYLWLKVTSLVGKKEEKEFLKGEELKVTACTCITKEMLQAVCSSFSPTDEFLQYINKYARDFNVCTPLRIAHFLAQVAHESACFTATKEDLGYTKKNIRDIWGWKRVKIKGVKTRVHRETMTANSITIKIWNDLSVSKITGDSKFANWRYKYTNKEGNIVNHRGRGYIHLTWKSNYEMYTTYYQTKYNDLIKDFVETPDLLEETKYALESSFFFWDSTCKKRNGIVRKNVINKIIDDGKLNLNSSLADHNKIVTKVCKKINPGLRGLVDRKKKFKLILNYLKEL
ncbi:MAG: LysM peptidoglycan-binding domain-containing protein [Sulfurovum sp.]|nr:LysM peptidoglycan-binding domain-containing protein [Sulfurovum sp.]